MTFTLKMFDTRGNGKPTAPLYLPSAENCKLLCFIMIIFEISEFKIEMSLFLKTIIKTCLNCSRKVTVYVAEGQSVHSKQMIENVRNSTCSLLS